MHALPFTFVLGLFCCWFLDMGYSKAELMNIGNSVLAHQTLHPKVWGSIVKHGINVFPQTVRGRRAGRNRQRTISTIISKRDNQNNAPRQISHSNLISVKLTPRERHIPPLRFGALNARSLRNKHLSIVDYVIDNDLDVVAFTETWLSADSSDDVTCSHLSPPGYVFSHVPRPNGVCGGVGILHKSSLKAKLVSSANYKSFEVMQTELTRGNRTLLVNIIYRPPPSPTNGLTSKLFLSDFSDFLETLILSQSQLVIAGDFNYHIDNPSCRDAQEFLGILESYGCCQHVKSSTHIGGHILDLIITRATDHIVSAVSTDSAATLSDHYWLKCDLAISKPPFQRKTITCRKTKSINREKFQQDITDKFNACTEQNDGDKLVSAYNNILSDLFDLHAPAKQRTITLRPQAPWYTSDIGQAKKHRRKAERKMRSDPENTHLRKEYTVIRDETNKLIQLSKQNYYLDLVRNAKNSKTLFEVMVALTKPPKSESILPSAASNQENADNFNTYFIDKIVKLRDGLSSMPVSDQLENNRPNLQCSLKAFSVVTETEVRQIIGSSKSSTCTSDPIPTALVKDCLDSLAPIICNLVNVSLQTGHMPTQFKRAIVKPLIKKQSLDKEVLKNYRPISNLAYVSKVIEMAVCKQLKEYLNENNLMENFQSAYRVHHGVETAVLRVHNDILAAIDMKLCVLLILLDLSAAFDTIEYVVLFRRLTEHFGISDATLKWIEDYLSQRSQSVVIEDSVSESARLKYGVPQGSVLGPLLFTLYMAPLCDILRQHSISFHCYADDTQIYISFRPQDVSLACVLAENCIRDVRTWMAQNFLCLNDSKTEVIVFGSRQNLAKLSPVKLTIGEAVVEEVDNVRNLGAILDKTLSMKNHINKLCQSAWLHLRKIKQIKSYLDPKSLETLIHSYITSKLDFMNSLLYGIPDYQIKQLQRVQNAAARLLSGARKFDHISPILEELHWLPVQYRIQYKLLLYVFKSLHNSAPKYIKDLIVPRTCVRTLRSSSLNLLEVPRSRTVRAGDRAFQHAAPVLWNRLPPTVINCDNLELFKVLLKTYLFQCAFHR